MAIIVKLIYTESRKGLGQDDNDPVRMCPELWTKAGVQIAYHDPHKPENDWFRPSLMEERKYETAHIPCAPSGKDE